MIKVYMYEGMKNASVYKCGVVLDERYHVHSSTFGIEMLEENRWIVTVYQVKGLK
ncbi:hypothetical protein [Bacillus thuringiensis]|uniref:hypothetical protein n=1 Tax=Bacillus thuringiensis TaxID=1428 RepID=UPI0013E2E6A7|nr:hypothetical protein [Bacillus thuringiensis]